MILDWFYKFLVKIPPFYRTVTSLFTLGYWDKWQDEVLPELTGKKILEIGPGPGKLLLKMAKRGYEIYGVEMRHSMVEEAKKRLNQENIKGEIHHALASHTSFKNEMFDCIVATFVLSEIENLDKTITEMKRILKKGGKVIIIGGSLPQDRNFWGVLFYKLINIFSARKFGRDNVRYFRKYGFAVTRHDFGPFHIFNKIVAIKK